MISYDLIHSINSIDLSSLSNFRQLIPILFKSLFFNQKNINIQNLTYLEFNADDFDTIISLLNIKPNLTIFSLQNEVFNNDFIHDELQSQINSLSSSPNISFINTHHLIQPNYVNLLNQISFLYIGPFEPTQNNIKTTQSLLKSIPEFTPTIFYPSDDFNLNHAEKIINWLENRWFSIFKERLFIFQKMRLDYQLDYFGFSIQPNIFNTDLISQINLFFNTQSFQKYKIDYQRPHYQSQNLIDINHSFINSIINPILSNHNFKQIIDFIKYIYKLETLHINKIFLKFNSSKEMYLDIKNISQKKIILPSTEKNTFNQKEIFIIIIPLQNNNHFYQIILNQKEIDINCPLGGLIIGSLNHSFLFPNLSNQLPTQNYSSFLVFFLEK